MQENAIQGKVIEMTNSAKYGVVNKKLTSRG